MKPCTRCPNLYQGKGALCPTCKQTDRAASRRRNPPTPDTYHTAHYRHHRHITLTRHPTCQTPHCNNPSQVTDHNPPRTQLEALGIHDPDHHRWLTALCAPCHNRKTALHDGGFGRTPTKQQPVDNHTQ